VCPELTVAELTRRAANYKLHMPHARMRGRKSIGHRIGAMLDASALKNERINKLVLDTQAPVRQMR